MSYWLNGYNPSDLYTGPGVSGSGSGPSGSGDVGYAPPAYNGGGSSSLGPGATATGTDLSGLLQNIMSQAANTGTNYANMVQDLFDYSEQNSAFNAKEAEKARDWSADQNKLAMQHSASEAQKTREWQEKMSNSGYQRATQDLIAAGLNPVLAAGGNPASTPSGATGQAYTGGVSSASADNSSGAIGSLFGSVINSAASMEMQDKTLAFNAQQLAQQKYLAELSAETSKYVSQNSLLGYYISANAQMAAAGTSASAQRYVADKNDALQRYIADQNAQIQYANQQNQRYMNEQTNTQSGRNSIAGSVRDFIDGLNGGNDLFTSGPAAIRKLGNALAGNISDSFNALQKAWRNRK